MGKPLRTDLAGLGFRLGNGVCAECPAARPVSHPAGGSDLIFRDGGLPNSRLSSSPVGAPKKGPRIFVNPDILHLQCRMATNA